MPRSRRVVIVQRSLRAYRRPFYDRLRPAMAERGVSLELLHGTDDGHEPGAVPPWAERVPTRVWSVRDRQLVWHSLRGRLQGADLVIVEQAVQNLVNYPLLVRQRLGGPRVAFWGHGRSFHLGADPGGVTERMKAASTRRAHWFFAYNELAVAAARELGFPPDRITDVRNSTDTAALRADVDATSDADVEAARAELGLRGAHVCAFLGSVDHIKRLDFLLAAADLVKERVPDLELMFIGEGSAVGDVRAATADRAWVHWAGTRTGRSLAALLRATELLLVPGWAGLVVVDSFAAGVPLVASSSAPHPPEISYLTDGVNGRLVDDDGDPAAFAAAVAALLEDDRARAELAAGARAAADRYGVEGMADRFGEGILRALDRPARGRSS